ncbi:hypothetical protein FZEAL_6575 [Fusarium zealandicum]|uniref:EKC/KEOPS complex subunit BUD32 n=1 Tax=Fusarium zealandicum TaxID=1053134 RepID=A0A8H4UHM4_9HYPO|nr:hypothetical protein FZEAL_6575 [Fusarium zealandicum]
MLPKRPPVKATGPPWSRAAFPVPDLPLEPDRLWRRLYVRAVDDELEKLHGFRPGGYHPLGHGGFSTVWLGQDLRADPPAYAAIKIILASQTEKANPDLLLLRKLEEDGVDMMAMKQHLCLPQTQFRSQSPSGTRLCLVYPVLGPPVQKAAGIVDGEDDAIKVLQKISYKIVEALALLHSHHVCHGDFRPSNILLRLKSLDAWDEQDVLSLMGEPETTEVHIRKDSRPTPAVPYAPKYLVYPPDFECFELSDLSPSVQVIDFGQSFNIDKNPLPTTFCIPANYASPEVIIDSAGTESMDLWSLGCTLYETRLGERLFGIFQLIGLRKQDYMDETASVLGQPPKQ